MSISITGAEWKRFYSDPAYWPKGQYHEDEIITINGKNAPTLDLINVQDDAVLTISGGDVYTAGNDHVAGLEDYLQTWMLAQNTTSFVVSVPHGKLEALKKAIKEAGGKIQGVDPFVHGYFVSEWTGKVMTTQFAPAGWHFEVNQKETYKELLLVATDGAVEEQAVFWSDLETLAAQGVDTSKVYRFTDNGSNVELVSGKCSPKP